MTIVESTVWIDYLRYKPNEHTRWLEKNLTEVEIGLTDLIYCEVLRGVGDASEYKRTRNLLLNFPVFNTGGIEVATAAADGYLLLRAKGHTIRKTIDCVIAAFCIREGFSLLHHDRDYDPFQRHLKLQVIDPS